MKKRIVVIGAGESGLGAALLAQHKGYDIFVSSKNKIEEKYKIDLVSHAIDFEEGGHTIDKILNAQLIIKSPGVPRDIEVLRMAVLKKIEVIDEVEFASKYINGKIIAITGTNGKTTVSRLLCHLMKTGGASVALSGNVGKSIARTIIEGHYDWHVVELSSFQLEGIKTMRPAISVLLNITPDHLDKYDYNFENYIKAKFRVTQHATASDWFIYYMNDPAILKGLENSKIEAKHLGISLKENTQASIFFDGTTMNFKFWENPAKIEPRNPMLIGPHNCINMMAAISAAYLAGISLHNIEKGLSTFKNAPHRMESIATIQGVEFVNDSKATNVDATMHALESYETPLVWIAGGVDKGNNYDQIRKQVQEKVKTLLCIGKENKKLKDYFMCLVPRIKETHDIKKLVKMAMEEADKGDVVLLSPACASFDLFTSYEDRGDQFREAVLQLKDKMRNVVRI